MQSRFTSKAQEALNYAADTAAMLGHGYIGSEHLLIGPVSYTHLTLPTTSRV